MEYRELTAEEAQDLWDCGVSIEWKFTPSMDWNTCHYDPYVKVKWCIWRGRRLADSTDPRMRVKVE